MHVDIQQITVSDFERHGAARSPMMLMVVEELEFYSAHDGWYLGVLLRDRSDHDFAYAILGPDPKGSKRWIAGADSVKDQAAARASLLEKLRLIAAKGRLIHEQE
jgi:hypothetical protein